MLKPSCDRESRELIPALAGSGYHRLLMELACEWICRCAIEGSEKRATKALLGLEASLPTPLQRVNYEVQLENIGIHRTRDDDVDSPQHAVHGTVNADDRMLTKRLAELLILRDACNARNGGQFRTFYGQAHPIKHSAE